jgi:hypothetical protein
MRPALVRSHGRIARRGGAREGGAAAERQSGAGAPPLEAI